MTTLTKSATVVTPTLVDGYQAASDVPTQKHVLLSGSVRYITEVGQPRTGTLTLRFSSRTDAFAAYTAHRTAGVWLLADSDLPQLNMKYVVNGSLEIELEDESRNAWTVRVPFFEVP